MWEICAVALEYANNGCDVSQVLVQSLRTPKHSLTRSKCITSASRQGMKNVDLTGGARFN